MSKTTFGTTVKVQYQNKYYKVQTTNLAMGEDGEPGPGYAIINKETNITERTSTVLPEAIQVAAYYKDMLEHLLEGKTDPGLSVVPIPTDDIVPQH